MTESHINRRSFLEVLGVTVGSAAAGPAGAGGPQPIAGDLAPQGDVGAEAVSMRLRINGQWRDVRADPRASLLDVLRKRLDLTGTKKGCDAGHCGACTIHVNGERRLSCLTLAIRHQADDIATIEGLADGEALHPVQQAFLDHDALQCGYCTPGQIMSAVACIREGHAGSESEIKEFMSGNICRCGAYPNIVSAVVAAKTTMEG